MIALCPQSSHGQTKKVFLSRISWKSLARTTDKGSSQAVKGVSLRRYAKFKCYCDTTTAKKTKAIEETTAAIEAAEAQLEDLRAQNTKLSQEVAQLESDLAANKAAREEATALRDKEKAEFEQTKEVTCSQAEKSHQDFLVFGRPNVDSKSVKPHRTETQPAAPQRRISRRASTSWSGRTTCLLRLGPTRR